MAPSRPCLAPTLGRGALVGLAAGSKRPALQDKPRLCQRPNPEAYVGVLAPEDTPSGTGLQAPTIVQDTGSQGGLGDRWQVQRQSPEGPSTLGGAPSWSLPSPPSLSAGDRIWVGWVGRENNPNTHHLLSPGLSEELSLHCLI